MLVSIDTLREKAEKCLGQSQTQDIEDCVIPPDYV